MMISRNKRSVTLWAVNGNAMAFHCLFFVFGISGTQLSIIEHIDSIHDVTVHSVLHE